MRDFNRDRGSRDRRGGGFGGGRSSGRGGSFGGGRPEMHRATCAECGASCEVPFKPTGDKPVYCSNCFAGRENSNPRGSNDRDFSRSRGSRDRDFSKPSFGDRDRQMFKVVCDECGKDCEVPFKPSPDKPVYCDECFGKGDGSRKGSGKNGSSDKQFELLNAKLDKLIDILTPKNNVIKLSSEKKEEVKKNDAKEEVKKVEVKKVDKKKNIGKEAKKVISKPVKKELKKTATPKVKTTKKTIKKK